MSKILPSTIILTTLATAGAGGLELVESTIEPLKEERKKKILDRVHATGDLRLRYESIERDDKDNSYKNRYRFRVGLNVDLTDDFTFDSGMRSGYANPTSGNQTFEEEPWSDYFMQSLRVNILGLSYEKENTKYKIGRQPYLMYRPIKSQLVWDNDISMNGINYQYKDDKRLITLGLNQPTLEEASVAQKDVNLLIAQYVHTTKIDAGKLNLGTGVYVYDGLKGNTTLFGDNEGNTLDANKLYENDYRITEGFAELELKDILGKPLTIAGGVAYNVAAQNNNFGYDVAAQLGKAKDIGEWQVKYSYTDIQEDAVLGAYCDSDNFGGGTASKGHAIRTKYKAGKNLFIAGNFFFNKLYASKSNTHVEADYERVQLDAIIKF